MAGLLFLASVSPAVAACIEARCTDEVSIDSVRALLESTCGCTEPGQTHQKYRRCVKSSLKLPSVTSLLPEKHCRALVFRCESASICGKPNAAVCCTLRRNGKVRTSIVGSATACRKGTPCGAAFGLFTESDACSADATCAGAVTTTTTTTTSIPTGPTTTLPQSSLPNVSLTGCATSGYVGPLTVGSQSFSVVVDSGSTTLAVGATACAGCAGISPLYAPGASATNLGATASETFGDGSNLSGSIFRDDVSLAGSSVPLAFVAIASQHNFFGPAACNFVNVPNSYQGIFGLGGTSLAVAGTGSFLDTLESTSPLGDAFAVQLCGVGGRLWLGGYDPASVTATPVFTPLAVMDPFYAVALEDIQIGGTSLGVPQAAYGDTLVDIGTTALVLPDAAFSALATAVAANPVFQQNIGGALFFSGNSCFLPAQGLTKTQLDAMLPALTLVVPSPTGQTVTLDLPATESYLLQQDDTQGNAYYCSGIERGSADSPTIIGANALLSLITIFDRQHGQIGFAPQQGCPPLGGTTLSVQPPSGVTPPPPTLPAPPYRHHRG